MSPRSFAGISQKMKFLQEICKTFLEQIQEQYQHAVDIMDEIFLIQEPKFNHKNVFISLT